MQSVTAVEPGVVVSDALEELTVTCSPELLYSQVERLLPLPE